MPRHPFQLALDFIEKYPELPIVEQAIVKCLSINFMPLGKTKLLHILVALDVPGQTGTKVNNKEMNRALSSLGDLGFITSGPKGSRCKAELLNIATHIALEDGSAHHLVPEIFTHLPTNTDWHNRPYYTEYDHLFRDLRIAIYFGANEEEILSLFARAEQDYYSDFHRYHPFEHIFISQFDNSLLHSMPTKVVVELLQSSLVSSFLQLSFAGYALEIADELCTEEEFLQSDLPFSLLLHRISMGEFTKARELLNKLNISVKYFSYLGWINLLEGQYEQSLQAYRDGLVLMKKTTRKRKLAYDNIAGVFYSIALLHSGDQKNIEEAIDYIEIIKKAKNGVNNEICKDIHQTLIFHGGMRSKARTVSHSLAPYSYLPPSDSISILIAFLTEHWQERDIQEDRLSLLEHFADMSHENGYLFLAKEGYGLLANSEFSTKENKLIYKQLKQDLPHKSLFDLIEAKPKWQQALTALQSLSTERQDTPKEISNERVVWQLNTESKYQYIEIVPRLQKLGKNGKWLKGRALGLSTLYSYPEKIEALSSQDLRAVATLKQNKSHYYGESTSYYFNEARTLNALVGHPHIYLADNLNVAIELTTGMPEFHIERTQDGFALFLKPFIGEGEKYRLIKESPTRLKYIACTAEYEKIRDIIGTSLSVPQEQQAEIVAATCKIAHLVTIHSDIAGIAGDAEIVETSSLPHVQLLPSGEGLSVEILCKPISGGQYYRPGHGGENVVSEIEGKQVQAKRDLSCEVSNTLDVIENCTTLQEYIPMEREWFINRPLDCLELLEELHTLGDSVILEWPKDQNFKIVGRTSSQNLSMQIQKDREWFKAEGSLSINDDLVLSMKELLQLCKESESRFVQLDDGTFLALTKHFKNQLDDLRAYSEPHGKGVRFHPLASLALSGLTEELEYCTTDKEWQQRMKLFQQVVEPELPSTLQANLRGYQLEGFRWLGRLSQWQVGACLADDMGLGKTIQALAAILLRAPDGPTLVVAPTSVLMNWIDEAQRFTPTLQVKLFADGDREQNLANLQSFDLVICSYGLLHTEIEKLSQVQWQTVVLDEAQAIKNMRTKRALAATKLQAEFRIITTGTPIENHLSELWSLFRFINPGLLGSHESFRTKFAIPIEKNGDKDIAKQLKKLIQPFILRRLKGDVLQELPSRTEVNIQVDMSENEAAMYEAQRQGAIEAISAGGNADGHQYIQVLAEITKLRRFCCNPQLVMPDAKLGSAKLEVFTEIVQDLVENNHKALVFSQFVGHLSLIRERLDTLGISYQYLDGSTPVKQRALRVKEFQSGNGDLFLISLKAGGSGLNLTAADYVIHMDPWWNPAVEDQASDRAHRIGQQRPVTIYRLIVKNSIEEKIVGLHRDKRDLADSLLAGSDVSGSFSASQLLGLLKEK